MSLFDNFSKDHEKQHYSRHPKAKIVRNVIYVVLIIILGLVAIRTINLI